MEWPMFSSRFTAHIRWASPSSCDSVHFPGKSDNYFDFRGNSGMTFILCDDDFPGKRAVYVSEISRREQDADRPPHCANLQAVVSRFSVGHGHRVNRIAPRQNQRIEPEDDASQHAGQIGTRGEESLSLIALH